MGNAAYAAEIDAMDVTGTSAKAAAPAVRATRAPATRRASPKSDAGSILGAVMQAASRAEVDADKVERLMKMYKEIRADEAERAFNLAMKAAQSEMRTIGADATNPQTRSKYATYAKLDSVLRPIYTRHGFSLSYDEADSPKPEHIRVLCYVAHEDGHTRTYRKDMPADGKGAKGGDVMTKTHAAGAAASYGARYLLKGVFNVAVGDEDADGNEPKSAETISPRQTDEIRALIDEMGVDIRRFCAHFQIAAVADLRTADFASAVSQLNAKRKVS